jgi:uncharacterized protein
MRIRELRAAECGEILARTELGRLACARNDQPYIVPIHFSFDPSDKCLYAFSTIGQKILWMRENPKVCVEIEEITDKNHWTTVVVLGRYHELADAPEDAGARTRAQALFERRREWWLPALAKTDTREHHTVVIYRIWIDRISGRRASRG